MSSNNAGKRLSSAAAADLIVCHCHPHHRPPPSSPSVVHHINVYANFERKIAKKSHTTSRQFSRKIDFTISYWFLATRTMAEADEEISLVIITLDIFSHVDTIHDNTNVSDGRSDIWTEEWTSVNSYTLLQRSSYIPRFIIRKHTTAHNGTVVPLCSVACFIWTPVRAVKTRL